jgi:hypothetical protein
MKDCLITLLFMVPTLLTGCAAKIPLDSDPRIGEEVQQVCFVHNLISWQDVGNDRKAVILRVNNGESFKLKLSDDCNPNFGNLPLAVITHRGSNCFSRGDRVKAVGYMSRGQGFGCIVTSIHKWDAKAVSKTEKAEQYPPTNPLKKPASAGFFLPV